LVIGAGSHTPGLPVILAADDVLHAWLLNFTSNQWRRLSHHVAPAACFDEGAEDRQWQNLVSGFRTVVQGHWQIRLLRQRAQPLVVFIGQAANSPERKFKLNQSKRPLGSCAFQSALSRVSELFVSSIIAATSRIDTPPSFLRSDKLHKGAR
jgi:hypothetical protein